ncbi:peptide/nickel transport system permease protein [Propionicimonas paludicola]|uniref:Peptide/nickel transport system permease protein n=1 Tax=Propionicimonas paludicola TaxID=185243 RepID=A0A2A9CU19_9ACTN|nr:ABC transporter permease [Propionicimonas paludicola]PFG17616.1 peptide/nickel transport system permease protein [Propionicimonas paludicola]
MSVHAQHSKTSGSVWHFLRRDPRFWAGAVAVAIVVVIAVAGPLLAPHDPAAFVGKLYLRPSATSWLGTDVLGRDVLSRLLVGGRLFLIQGLTAATLGVLAGVVLGILLGVTRGTTAAVLLFCSDSVMVIPQILLVLLILAAFGSAPLTLTVAVALAQVAYTARVIFAATGRVTTEDYYRAARAVGMGTGSLVLREVLPNVAPAVLVEYGVRLSISFVALASLSYLGFGSGDVDWGAMIHENQGGIALQPWAVVAPVLVLAAFLLGMNLLRDGLARALAARSAR